MTFFRTSEWDHFL